MENFIAEPLIHKGEKRIKLVIDFQSDLIEKVKQIEGRRWSASMRCWHVPFNKLNCNRFNLSYLYFDEIELQKTDSLPVNSNEYCRLPKNAVEVSNIEDAVFTLDEYNQLIFIRFLYNQSIKDKIKKLNGAWWHSGLKQWSVHYNDDNLEKLKEIFSYHQFKYSIKIKDLEKKRKVYARKPANYSRVPEKFIQELRLQNRSENTIKSYRAAVSAFLDYFKDKKAENITIDEIRDYILHFRFQQNYSPAFQNQVISSLKVFYRIMYSIELNEELLPRPKKSRQLPRVISKEEVESLLHHTKNQKHKLILMLMYGAGLRVGEVIKLRIEDIDLNRKQLNIYNAKGRKDRTVNLTLILCDYIKRYLRDFAPHVMLFNGQGNIQYSTESISKMIKKSAQKAGIKKKVTAHVLRHCYATHMLEKGVDLRYIQYLLGHKSSRTTEIYTHVSTHKISELGSPIDDIKL